MIPPQDNNGAWACPVCGESLDDCYDDDPGWMLCRGDDEWSGYWDDLVAAWKAKADTPNAGEHA